MAFVESDLHALIGHGLSAIPAGCALACAINQTVCWARSGMGFSELREYILEEFASDNFTDVKMNFPFMIAGLLLGKGDFSKSICTAVNFGRDTDCTGATVGAILGIVDPDCIPQEYLKPIGSDLVISKGIKGITPPPTLDALSDLVASLRDRIEIVEEPEPPKPDFSHSEIHFRTALFKPWFAQDDQKFCPSLAKAESELWIAPGHFFI